jgi:hypothetical protein
LKVYYNYTKNFFSSFFASQKKEKKRKRAYVIIYSLAAWAACGARKSNDFA